MGMKQRLEVVGAVVRRDGRFLLGQRPEGKSQAGRWEFVGGKVEAGETLEEALARECREELALEIRGVRVCAAVTHEYPDRIVHLTLLECVPAPGSEPVALEHRRIGWFSPEEIPGLPLSAADAALLPSVLAFSEDASTERENML